MRNMLDLASVGVFGIGLNEGPWVTGGTERLVLRHIGRPVAKGGSGQRLGVLGELLPSKRSLSITRGSNLSHR